MTRTLFNITLASEGGCRRRSSQGNYKDRLTEDLIKIAATIIYPCGLGWRHKEEVQQGKRKKKKTNKLLSRATALMSVICVYSLFQLLQEALTSQQGWGFN